MAAMTASPSRPCPRRSPPRALGLYAVLLLTLGAGCGLRRFALVPADLGASAVLTLNAGGGEAVLPIEHVSLAPAAASDLCVWHADAQAPNGVASDRLEAFCVYGGTSQPARTGAPGCAGLSCAEQEAGRPLTAVILHARAPAPATPPAVPGEPPAVPAAAAPRSDAGLELRVGVACFGDCEPGGDPRRYLPLQIIERRP